MDEFRKPFEYDDEKKGLILVFVILLISIDIFLALSLTVQVYNILTHIPVLATGFMILGILYILFILFTALTCYKLNKNMVIVSKIYLIVRAVFSTCCLILIFINILNDKRMIGNGAQQYKNVNELTFIVFLAPLFYTLVFSALWFLYFLKSKRFKEFGKKQTLL